MQRKNFIHTAIALAALSLLPARWHDRILLGQPRKPRAHQAGATPIPGLSHPHDKT